MNPDIKQRWVDALRSGEFEQGKGGLRSPAIDGMPEAFCCLGVLCELAARDGVIERNILLFSDGGVEDIAGYDGQWAYLPESVVTWAGLSDASYAGSDDAREGLDVLIPLAAFTELFRNPAPVMPTLSRLNDNNVPFGKIADVIERNL